MINEQTIEKLRTMRLHAMAEFIQTTLLGKAGSDLSSAEQIGLMVDQEWTAREKRRLHRNRSADRVLASTQSRA